MKRSLITALCLGFAGVTAGHAQVTSLPPLFVSNTGSFSGSGGGFVSGTTVTAITSSGLGQNVNTSFATAFEPVGITSNGQGTMFVSAYDRPNNINYVQSFSAATGGAASIVATNGGIIQPTGLNFGPDGQLYVVNSRNPGTGFGSISTVNVQTGGVQMFNTLSTASLFNGSYGIALGPDGNFYVANAGTTGANANSILRVIGPFNGTQTVPAGTVSVVPVTAVGLGGNLAAPTGLVFDSLGNLYVTNTAANDVVRITGITGATANSTLFATNPTGITGPEGITIGPDGNLYYANDTGQVLTTTTLLGGVATVFATESADFGPTFLAFASVPEPSTYVLFSVAGGALLVFGVRRRNAQRA